MAEGKNGHINLAAVGDDGNIVNQMPQDHDRMNNTNDIQKEHYPPKRQQWTNGREFLLSCIAMAVGVGNVWRFPFIAYDNGGGAFLIPYFMVLLLIARPLFYLELVLGQLASSGSVKIWELSPAFRGIGYGQVLSNWAVTTFYVSLMALCVYYFFGSFSSILPWALCGSWSTENCFDANTTLNLSSFTLAPVTAAEEYFKNEVLKADPQGFDSGMGPPDLRLALCLLFSWIIVFCVQVKGVKSSGKTAYFTALFPYVVLLIMLIRGVTLPGSLKGILFFITPRWEKLLEPKVWYAAVDQCFFSLSIGFGPAIMFGSYNTFRQNIYRDSTIISLLDAFTCVFAGFTIFSILGHLSELLGVEIQDVVRGGGTPLAFISYPDALARFHVAPQVFSVLFFFMLFTLGIGSASGLNQVTVTVICDAYPKVKQWQGALFSCLIGFFVGLIYTTPQGQHILTLVNHYGGGVSIIFLMTLEVVGVMWVYGIRNVLEDIEFMLNRRMGLYWKFCWCFFNPLFLAIVFIYYQFTADRLTYGSYIFGDAPTYAGMSFAALSCLMVPVFFFVELYQHWNEDIGTWCNVSNIFKPTPKWGPTDPMIREEYRKFKLDKRTTPTVDND